MGGGASPGTVPGTQPTSLSRHVYESCVIGELWLWGTAVDPNPPLPTQFCLPQCLAARPGKNQKWMEGKGMVGPQCP